jgi:Mn-dependent DtxR family transcriptional regulator
MPIKPSAEAILTYLRHRGEFVTSTEIVRHCYTTTPSKRLDELHDAGLIEKKPYKGRQMAYRALSMPEILMGRIA